MRNLVAMRRASVAGALVLLLAVGAGASAAQGTPPRPGGTSGSSRGTVASGGDL